MKFKDKNGNVHSSFLDALFETGTKNVIRDNTMSSYIPTHEECIAYRDMKYDEVMKKTNRLVIDYENNSLMQFKDDKQLSSHYISDQVIENINEAILVYLKDDSGYYMNTPLKDIMNKACK